MKFFSAIVMSGVILLSFGCATTKVDRVSVDSVTDLSGRWNDTDSRLVADEMVSDALSKPWISRFTSNSGSMPVLIVGTVRNQSSEHIQVQTFVKDIERELVNSGRVGFVAGASERLEIRQEREEQQFHASEETAKALGQELGADFIMQGVITSIEDRAGKQRAVTYSVDMELISIETNQKVWIGNKKIKKMIKQSGSKW